MIRIDTCKKMRDEPFGKKYVFHLDLPTHVVTMPTDVVLLMDSAL
jgi:hypothetical protein